MKKYEIRMTIDKEYVSAFKSFPAMTFMPYKVVVGIKPPPNGG